MRVLFSDRDWERLETDLNYSRGFAIAIVKAYRKRMQFIRAAPDERTMREWRSLRFKQLQGNRSHQHSMRLNDQWRLIVEISTTGSEKAIRIVGIEDIHK